MDGANEARWMDPTKEGNMSDQRQIAFNAKQSTDKLILNEFATSVSTYNNFLVATKLRTCSF